MNCNLYYRKISASDSAYTPSSWQGLYKYTTFRCDLAIRRLVTRERYLAAIVPKCLILLHKRIILVLERRLKRNDLFDLLYRQNGSNGVLVQDPKCLISLHNLHKTYLFYFFKIAAKINLISKWLFLLYFSNQLFTSQIVVILWNHGATGQAINAQETRRPPNVGSGQMDRNSGLARKAKKQYDFYGSDTSSLTTKFLHLTSTGGNFLIKITPEYFLEFRRYSGVILLPIIIGDEQMKNIYRIRVTNGINKGYETFANSREEYNEIKAELKLSPRTKIYAKKIPNPMLNALEHADATL